MMIAVYVVGRLLNDVSCVCCRKTMLNDDCCVCCRKTVK